MAEESSYLKTLSERVLPDLLFLAKKDQRILNFVVSIITKDLPTSMEKKRINQEYVKELKRILTAMSNDGQSRRLAKTAHAYNTARVNIFASIRYIVDYEDPNGFFKEITDRVEVNCNEKTEEICLIVTRQKGQPLFEESTVASTAEEINWRVALGDFFEAAAPGTGISLKQLTLNEDDVAMVETLFKNNSRFNVHVLTNDEIKVSAV